VKILLRKTSLVDYPGRVSSVLFLPGCNLRCPWCHNRELALGGGGITGGNAVDPGSCLAHLKKRRPVLGGAVISGGEPCLWEGLPGLIAEIKKLGLPVKVDTNGTVPAMLERLFASEGTRPDYIALDLKTAPERYRELPSAPSNNNNGFDPAEALRRSAALIRQSGIAHEYRTLALPGGFITGKDMEALAPLADGSPWFFRRFRGGNCLDPAWDALEENEAEAAGRADALAEKARELGKNGLVPGALAHASPFGEN
jgi:pyruvate formate lyase activating enzyme